MGRKDKIDWELIRQEYINTNISTRKLADKYGVSPSSVLHRCRDEKWAEQRENNRIKVASKVHQKAIGKRVDSLEKIVNLADRVADQIEGLLEDELNDPSILLQTRQHNREIESKVNALCKLYELRREYMGLMPVKDAEKLKLERERFEAEKKRAETEQNTDKAVRIELEGDIEQWSH